jgi:hypothetical protein
MLSEGKRLNTEHTDLWDADNSERTDREMSNLLNLVYTTEEMNVSVVA